LAQIPVTRVRHTESEANQLLQYYVFTRQYGPMRPPRGIEPDQVARFLQAALTPNSTTTACERALELMRFYEIRSLSAHVQGLLTGGEQSFGEILRSAFLVQALADLGTAGDAAWAAGYCEKVLLRKYGFPQAADVLLTTELALAPYGNGNEYVKWLRAEITAADSPQTYGKLREAEANRLPGLAYLMAGKRRLLGAAPDERRRESILIYLRESDLSHGYLVTWAARLIRDDAAYQASAILTEFSDVLDSLAADPDREPEGDFTIVRAAQAILYLQGSLTPAQRKLYEASHPGETQNFLWDDEQMPEE
jgi:hypothetical protein